MNASACWLSGIGPTGERGAAESPRNGAAIFALTSPMICVGMAAWDRVR